MSSMQLCKLIPTNKIVDEVYEKHIRNPLDEWVSGKIQKGASYTEEDVSTVICLYIFGAKYDDISLVTPVTRTSIASIVGRRTYKNIRIPFVKNIRKIRGKMVTSYDENKVIDYFNSLPPNLKNVTIYTVVKERLNQAAKI